MKKAFSLFFKFCLLKISVYLTNNCSRNRAFPLFRSLPVVHRDELSLFYMSRCMMNAEVLFAGSAIKSDSPFCTFRIRTMILKIPRCSVSVVLKTFIPQRRVARPGDQIKITLKEIYINVYLHTFGTHVVLGGVSFLLT